MEVINLNELDDTILLTCDNIPNLFTLYKNRVKDEVVCMLDIKIIDTQNLSSNNLTEYETQLKLIADDIIETYLQGRLVAVDVLTDIFRLNEISFELRMYLDGINMSYSTEYDDVMDFSEFSLANSHLCQYCFCFQCKPNPLVNIKQTNDMNTPPSLFCQKSHIELRTSRYFQEKLKSHGFNFEREVPDTSYAELLKNSITLNGNNVAGVIETLTNKSALITELEAKLITDVGDSDAV